MSKNTKRDERGCVILQGAKTFSEFTARPNSIYNRHFQLKEKAADKFARFVDAGQRPLPSSVDKEQLAIIEKHNEFARLPHEVKLHYYFERLKEAERELEKLKACGNERKIAFIRPTLETQIQMFKYQLLEIYEELKNES